MLRLSPPRQADLIQRHLLTARLHIYAAASYVKNHGQPKSVEELDDHRIVVYGNDTRPPVPKVNWLLEVGRKDGDMRRPAMSVNNVYAVMQAVQSGAGIGVLPEFMVREGNDMLQVLPDLEGPQIDAYFVYPEEVRTSKRTAVFRDFLLRKVAEAKF